MRKNLLQTYNSVSYLKTFHKNVLDEKKIYTKQDFFLYSFDTQNKVRNILIYQSFCDIIIIR